MLTGLKGAARNPTALTALRPAGSCNSAVSAIPPAAHFTVLMPTGFLFDFPMRDFKKGTPLFSGRGASQPHIAPLQKQERPASVREAEHLQALSADALLSAVLFRAG